MNKGLTSIFKLPPIEAKIEDQARAKKKPKETVKLYMIYFQSIYGNRMWFCFRILTFTLKYRFS